jgi:hypothetical protein
MGRACRTNEGRRGMHIGFWWESQERDQYQYIGGWILKWFLDMMGWHGLD